MKVAIVRGYSVNKWEMQSFEPLRDDIEFMCFSSEQNKYDASDIKLPVKKLKSQNRIKRSFYDLAALLSRDGGNFHRKSLFFYCQLREELQGFDIVHTAEISTNFTYTVCLLKKELGYKVVSTIWENIPFSTELDGLKAFVKGRTADKIDLFLPATRKAEDALEFEGIGSNKIKMIYPGIDLNKFYKRDKDINALKQFGFKEEKIVLFIGRLVYEKGVYDILNAAKYIMKKTGLNIKFFMIGKGREKGNIQRLIKMFDMENCIKVLDFIPYGDIPKFYNIADIVILPSIPMPFWQEQFGMVLAESMANSKAIISTSCGSIPEVLGDAALIIPPADYMALGDAILRVISDIDLKKDLEQKANERACRLFDAQKNCLKIKEAYMQVLNRKI